MESTVELVKAAVENYFETDGLNYEPFGEYNIAKAGFKIKTKFGSVDMLFQASERNLIIHTIIPIRASEDDGLKVCEFLMRANNGLKVCEFLMRANNGLKTGCFDFDFDSGRISYRVSIFCGITEFSPPTYEQIDYAVLVSMSTVKRYGDALMKVVFGLVEPEEAINEVEDED